MSIDYSSREILIQFVYMIALFLNIPVVKSTIVFSPFTFVPQGATLFGAKMVCAICEGASMKSCNFEDPAGSRTNMEGSNMKGCNLEGSAMANVNLRVANLRNANLQNCDLRSAVSEIVETLATS